MDGNLLDDGWIDRSVLQLLLGSRRPEHRKVFHFVQYIPAVQQATKDSVEVVQMGLSLIADEELGPIRVGTCGKATNVEGKQMVR